MTKNWIVIEMVEDFEFDPIEIDYFNTEVEAIAKITELEAGEIEEYGKVISEFSYYNINE